MAGTYALAEDDNDAPKGVRRFVPLIIGVVLLIAAAVAMYIVMNSTVGKAKKEPPTMTAVLLPPPPPPPPPPPQEKPPEPVETTKPVPVETPTPTPQKADTPAAVSIDAASEAGGDAFGLKGGGPGGMGGAGSTGTGAGPGGGGISDAFYGRYLSGALQERVENEKKISRQVFTADFNIWIDGSGRVTKAVLVRSSGEASRDAIVQALLEAVRGLDTPPASLRFPQKIAVRGRKSSF